MQSSADVGVRLSSPTVRPAPTGRFSPDSVKTEDQATGTWLALLAIVLVAIDLRPRIVSIGPILPSIRGEYGLSHTSASLLTAIPDVLMGLLALPAPALAKRHGRDRIILASLGLLFISMILRSLSHGVASLLLSTAGVGTGIAITGALVAGFIKESFPNRAATVMGVYATSLSLGSTVSAAATGPLAAGTNGGWRTATAFWSCLGIVGMVAWTVLTVRTPRADRCVPAATPVSVPLRNRTAWMIALFFALSNFLFYSVVAWTAPMFREFGDAPTTAGLLLASFTLAFTCGNPVFGTLSKSHDRRGWIGLSVAITLVGLVALALSPTSLPFVWLPLSAFGLAGTFTLAMTLPLDNTSSVEEANTWNGFVLTVGYLIAATGPITMGLAERHERKFQASTLGAGPPCRRDAWSHSVLTSPQAYLLSGLADRHGKRRLKSICPF